MTPASFHFSQVLQPDASYAQARSRHSFNFCCRNEAFHTRCYIW